MNNNLLQIKIKERLNKLSSLDYDNLECWQIAEAFNKAQIEWVRKQAHGNNIHKEGDESSKMLIDDLQKLLVESNITMSEHDRYFETAVIPANYLYYKRIAVKSKTDCCPSRAMTVYLTEMADVSNLLVDSFRKPSAEWGETFATMIGNRFRIYTNNEFDLEDAKLTYYRKPVQVTFAGCIDPGTGTATVDQECEFKDDIVEMIIEEATAILAGDIESWNQSQRAKTNSQTNN